MSQSKDVKDEGLQPGAGKKLTLGEELKATQDSNAKKLYDTKFVPWAKKAFKDTLPGAQAHFPQDEFGPGFNPHEPGFMAAWRQMATRDNMTIGAPEPSGNRQDDQYYFPVKVGIELPRPKTPPTPPGWGR